MLPWKAWPAAMPASHGAQTPSAIANAFQALAHVNPIAEALKIYSPIVAKKTAISDASGE
ncbi:hypothetical protein HNS03_13710 [Amorphus sp. 3PC139-8]